MSSRVAAKAWAGLMIGQQLGSVSHDTCTPDFDGLVPRAGHDLGSVVVEAHRRDGFAVGVLLAGDEL